MSQLIAEQIGADLSTTGLAVTVKDDQKKIETVVIDMQGACEWHGGAAHDVNCTPLLLLAALVQLQSKGWDFSEPGTLCFSVRQHDMIIANQEYDVLIPALSWVCNKAQVMAEVLNANTDVTDAVGHIEARFILAKVLLALQQDSSRQEPANRLMTTGDWIVGKFTDRWYL
ncbi:hypothetical protein IH781_03730, partial [Patescibacteria group bacterium]|nr:hypothetical protein [Patescibacteria group bacterium]